MLKFDVELDIYNYFICCNEEDGYIKLTPNTCCLFRALKYVYKLLLLYSYLNWHNF